MARGTQRTKDRAGTRAPIPGPRTLWTTCSASGSPAWPLPLGRSCWGREAWGPLGWGVTRAIYCPGRGLGRGPTQAPLGRVGGPPCLEPPRLQLPLFPHRQQQVRRLRKQEAPSHHRKRVCAASPPPGHCKMPTAPLPQAPHRGGPGCSAARSAPGAGPSDFSPHLPGPGLGPMSNGGRGLASRSPRPGLRASRLPLGAQPHPPEAAEPGPLWPSRNQNMGSGVTEKPPLRPKG